MSSILSGGGANSIKPIDIEFVKRALKANDWDMVIFGGERSKNVYKTELHTKLNMRVILMPHPASRNFTNNLKEKITMFVRNQKIKQVIEFNQLKDKKIGIKFFNKVIV